MVWINKRCSFKAKRRRHQADIKWKNTKLTIFIDLYRQAKRNVSKLVHTSICFLSCTVRIALSSSCNKVRQVVNTLSNRHPLRILDIIYASADLLSLYIIHSNIIVREHGANLASEPVTSRLHHQQGFIPENSSSSKNIHNPQSTIHSYCCSYAMWPWTHPFQTINGMLDSILHLTVI